MVAAATMVKTVPSSGVLTDKVPDLFKRHGKSSRFRGFAHFGTPSDTSVLLEVAGTPEEKARGLMGRKYLPEYCGMVFTDLTGGAFWMKGCKIPLDIVFINDDGFVSRTYEMPADGGVRRYSYGDERTAIELPYGFCARQGISVGTPCDWRTW